MKKQLTNFIVGSLIYFGTSMHYLAQNINAFAGTGVMGSSGDGGTATLAELKNPVSVVADNSGNVYVADNADHRIRKINSSGIISTFAGTGAPGFTGDGGPATAAQITGPCGLAADQLGNIYFCDALSRIRKIDVSGTISTIAGTGVSGYSGDGSAATGAQIYPRGLAIDAAGNIYVADGYNYRVRKINTAGIISTIAGIGTNGYTGDGGPAVNGQIQAAYDIAVDLSGNNIYFSTEMVSVVRKINSSGIISTYAGVPGGGTFNGDGIPANTANLNMPVGVALDVNGDLFIAVVGHNRIRMVTPSGTISTIAGTGISGQSGDGGLATAALLNGPYDVTLDPAGNIFIADAQNHRVRKISAMVPTPSICLVTVDSLGNNNEIYWEKTLYPQADTFIILRETSSLSYSPIGRIPKTAFSSYIDTNRSVGLFNGDPNFSFYKYKLQIKDTDGVLSPMSPYHQSIYIQDAQTGNFSWNYYFIEGIGNIQTASYILWRQNVLTGLSTTVGATSANVANDAQYQALAQTGNVKWFVSTKGFACNPSVKGASGSITRTKSNNTNERQFPAGIDIKLFEPANVIIYPNPAGSELIIRTNSPSRDLEFNLTDASGRIVSCQKMDQKSQGCNVEALAEGLYFVNIAQGNTFICCKKLIIKH
jgi:hypothetical protein